MSNIVVHKTTELDVSTNFTNNFLDGLLEQYCKDKYQENSIIADGVPNISLDTLVKFAYPGYYCKAPGLYANLASTHVMVVYQESLHNVLQEALSHKLSRLFVSYSSSDTPTVYFAPMTKPDMDLYNRFDLGMGRRMSRDFSTDYTFLVDNHLFNYYCKQSFGKSITEATYSVPQLRTNVAMIKEETRPVVIYKPTADAIRNLREEIYNRNFKNLEKSFFFSNTPQTVTASLWLAIHIKMSTGVADTLLKSVGQECAVFLRDRSNVILSQQNPIIRQVLNNLEEERLKEEREETTRRLKEKEKEDARQKAKIENSLRTIAEEKQEAEEASKKSEEDNSFVITILIAAVIAFIVYMINH